MACRRDSLVLPLLLLLSITIPLVSARGSPTSTPASPITTPNPVPTLVQQICKTTKYYDLCISSLRADPSSPTADTKGLALIMVRVAVANATATSSFLSSSAVSTSTGDPAMVKLLRDCADKYSLAGSSLQDSALDLGAESYDTAYMHILAARDYPNVCHNAFKRATRPAYPPELAQGRTGLSASAMSRSALWTSSHRSSDVEML
ncbi:hypothetical protein CRG98_037376 [Punica granatum]|uniref:Pectinesterase inhibitor domain-containing protein n=1 Tax=Punica granatum TaxID=22663 RepID=A0A2I0IF05_PUNGR|nr:hypothetical protein CRG98_037376 [Punica granatum]